MNQIIANSLLPILKQRRSPITASELAVKTGRSLDELEDALEEMLDEYPCKLHATSKGELTYDFQVDSLEEQHSWKDLWQQLKKWGIFAYKGWIVAMIYAYIWAYLPTIFLWVPLLILGPLTLCLLPLIVLSVFYMAIADAMQLPNTAKANYLRIRKFLLGKQRMLVKYGKIKSNFHQRVFSFVFGEPYRGALSQEEQDRVTVEYIASHKGWLTASELSLITGVSVEEAETDIVRLMSRYRGEVTVSSNGVLLYYFSSLNQAVEKGEKNGKSWYIWQRLPVPQAFNDNFIHENGYILILISVLGITATTSFFFGAAPPWSEIPILGSNAFPMGFALIFLVLSIKNRLAHRQERRKKIAHSRKILLLRHVLSKKGRGIKAISHKTWNDLASYIDGAEVSVDSEGELLYHLPRLEGEWEAVSKVRSMDLKSTLNLDIDADESEAINAPQSPRPSILGDSETEAAILKTVSELKVRKPDKVGYGQFVVRMQDGIEITIPAYDVSVGWTFGIFQLAISLVMGMYLLIVDLSIILDIILVTLILFSVFKAYSSFGKTNSVKIRMHGKKGKISGSPNPIFGPNLTFHLDNFRNIKIQPNDSAQNSFRMLFSIKDKQFPVTIAHYAHDRRLLMYLKQELYEYLTEQAQKQ
mgnify:CR=1 FL=1